MPIPAGECHRSRSRRPSRGEPRPRRAAPAGCHLRRRRRSEPRPRPLRRPRPLPATDHRTASRPSGRAWSGPSPAAARASRVARPRPRSDPARHARQTRFRSGCPRRRRGRQQPCSIDPCPPITPVPVIPATGTSPAIAAISVAARPGSMSLGKASSSEALPPSCSRAARVARRARPRRQRRRRPQVSLRWCWFRSLLSRTPSENSEHRCSVCAFRLNRAPGSRRRRDNPHAL